MGHGWHCQRRRAEAGLGPRGGCLGPWWGTIKVKLIKQDDGGSPIRHYLVKYRAVSSLLPRFLATPQPYHPPCWTNSVFRARGQGSPCAWQVAHGPMSGF